VCTVALELFIAWFIRSRIATDEVYVQQSHAVAAYIFSVIVAQCPVDDTGYSLFTVILE